MKYLDRFKMKQRKLNTTVLFLFWLGLPVLQAQEVISTSGANASGEGGTVSYSVGQIAYTTYIGTNGSVMQGVQQTYVIVVTTGIDNAKEINLVFTAFPNPTIDFLQLITEGNKLNSLSYQLYDIIGKLIIYNKVTETETIIPMSSLPSGLYCLKIASFNIVVKTFKVIKK